MTPSDQIKAIAADFLRALATVPGLFARWQSETSPAARGSMVRDELGLAHTPTPSDLERMAEYTQPQALAALSGSRDPLPTQFVVLAHAAGPTQFMVLAHEAAAGLPA